MLQATRQLLEKRANRRDAQRPRPQGRVSVESMTLKEAYSVPKHTSAICVQSFDDSLNSAIHITYRISLRSSSLREPRYPLLRVLDRFDFAVPSARLKTQQTTSVLTQSCTNKRVWLLMRCLTTTTPTCRNNMKANIDISQGLVWIHDNDPSAGSPTETLLRLLLPLDDRVCETSRSKARLPEPEPQSE